MADDAKFSGARPSPATRAAIESFDAGGVDVFSATEPAAAESPGLPC